MTPIAHALRTALLDFVWQGTLAAFLLWLTLFILRRRSANARYTASCVALAIMAILPVATAVSAYRMPAAAPTQLKTDAPAVNPALTASTPLATPSPTWLVMLDRWALPAWSLGVLLFSLRLVWASTHVSALRRHGQPPEPALLNILTALRTRMGLARPARVLIADIPGGPSVAGWMRPVLLLPVSALAGLTPEQLEAVLAHELAHIRRYDYLANMLQTLVETLLFYHPAVWWVSGRIRQERELCCDDIAVRACGDALCYARALTKLERLRSLAPSVAVGSTGGELLPRIQRLLGAGAPEYAPSKLAGIVALSLGLVCLAMNVAWARAQEHSEDAVKLHLANSRPDEPGIRVDTGAATVIHRAPVEYPRAAAEKGIRGTVMLELTVDMNGMVSDAHVMSGPPELRRAALGSVLEWHFTRDSAGSNRPVSIAFESPQAGSSVELAEKKARDERQARELESALKAPHPEGTTMTQELSLAIDDQKLLADQAARQASGDPEARRAEKMILEKRLAEMEAAKRLAETQQGPQQERGSGELAGRTLKGIAVLGLSDALRDDLLSRLPVHAGEKLSKESVENLERAIREFDEHLELQVLGTPDGQVEIRIVAPNSGYLWERRR